MPHKTLILSDTHLGKPGSPRADALRPVWQGVDELVINGDAAEVQIPWLRGTAVRELDRLEELARQDGIRVTLISGNHDAYLTDRRCLQLAEGSILVMHGDALQMCIRDRISFAAWPGACRSTFWGPDQALGLPALILVVINVGCVITSVRRLVFYHRFIAQQARGDNA